jgi:hypothetical protein
MTIGAGMTVKNTFLTFLDTPAPDRVQRSSSVPRTFKPGHCSCDDSPLCDDSTNASEKDVTDNESGDYHDRCSECTDRADSSPSYDTDDESDKSRVKLSLVDMVDTTAKARTKLRSQAATFKSVAAAPAEVTALIENAVAALSCCPDIIKTSVQHGGMGGTTIIVGESASTDPDVSWTFVSVKDTLLNSAEQSEKTYILGYGNQPFNTLDYLSFSASVVCVPEAHQETACWEMYEQGFCPRCSTCRWDHPGKLDTMRIVVMIKKQTQLTWLDGLQ